MASEPQNIDYESVLADLRSKREKLDAAIAGIEVMLGQTSTGSGVGVSKPGEPVAIAKDAFFQLSIVDATRKYLSMVKQPTNTKKIVEALLAGGYTSSSSNLNNTVFSVLKRQEKQVGDIIRVHKDWGLAEWYPGRRVKPSAKKGQNERNEDQHNEGEETEGEHS